MKPEAHLTLKDPFRTSTRELRASNWLMLIEGNISVYSENQTKPASARAHTHTAREEAGLVNVKTDGRPAYSDHCVLKCYVHAHYGPRGPQITAIMEVRTSCEMCGEFKERNIFMVHF
jgi:hypothetical protein